ncbi:LPXTG cell wall anchor domain-containing protein [Enterococcus hulanensis]|uniref:LPXTG cell wall anchor domain-containing protein n=1 Tax=Enterococcus hulanensis TaxID=2559929 RepID=A0ABU3F1H4_9ENTE|nr:LPXTG cell wall anchor domain-containing protein [Enterococcus hulanensis]MDT2600974.1 LPXTG cell wall anchor domain-containing protein [Enterococcus hulanensis]MDT2611563.1 LPXTG cell wall anchor domain-containing protein [Enterococcus hulanensis]MDT2617953.1 LPXTG cell wall anchor domain-containing protein [Enterococcus hulanensis]MDT2628956.1 LPXTG cell wall anchor domain-containing protein [Enterococcus hulanensis]MDT2656518.1 LPXTG cell wall anchor domain-containing protein [Enterococc
MNRIWKIITICTLIYVSISTGVNSDVFAASPTSPQDHKTTPVETKLLRKITPDTLPVNKGTMATSPQSISKSTLTKTALKQLPKTGTDTNFYGILGILLLTLIGVIKRYSTIKEV